MTIAIVPIMSNNKQEDEKKKKKEKMSKVKRKKKERTTEEKDELNAKALESLRRKAMQEIESEDATPRQIIDAGWRILHLYGFEGNELKKSWKWLKGY